MSRLAKTLDDENRFFSLLGRACDDEDDFQRAVEDTFWLTYRCGFPALSPYAFTDDAGWGCMLRSAQMMMANALRRHLDAGPAAGEGPETRRRRVLSWFVDSPSPDAVYSIHNFVKCGQQYDMLPGEWYGPSVAAHVLRDLCELHRRELGGPAVTVTVTSIEKPLCVEEILDKMTRHAYDPAEADENAAVAETDDDPLERADAAFDARERIRAAQRAARDARLAATPWPAALVVIVPLRLGLNALEPGYVPQILQALRLSQALGLVGGKPGRALFFPGVSRSDGETRLVGLDPHAVQPALLSDAFTTAHLASVRCDEPARVRPDRLDPSLALGFYCRDRADFLSFCAAVATLPAKGATPAFSVVQSLENRFVDDSESDDGCGPVLGGDDDGDEWTVV